MKAQGQTNLFYIEIMQRLLADGIIDREDSLLVICGGQTDYQVLSELGFSKILITNLDERMQSGSEHQELPYDTSYQNAENLTFADGSFGFVIVHSGLHHLRCPARGINEMYRVAKKGIVGFEPNRSWLTKLGLRLGYGQEYETAAVYFNECRWGGVNNKAIPNYVMRFSKSDIISTIQTYAPETKHMYRFWHATLIPTRLDRLKNPIFSLTVRFLSPILTLAGSWFNFMANNMAFYVEKPKISENLHPWLSIENGEIVPDKDWFNQVYK